MPICNKCSIDKPEKEFHVTGKSRTLRKTCKICVNEDRRNKRKENPEKFKNQDKTRYHKHKEKRKQAAKDYAKDNKSILEEHKKRYYDTNKSTISNKYKKYYDNNKEIISKHAKEYYDKNREAILAKKKEYRQTEKGKLAAKNGRHTRRAREKSTSDGTVTIESLKNKIDKQNHKCYYCSCNIELTASSSHIEHLIPLSRGGLHSIDNIVWSCSSCNLKKNNKTEEEYNEYISTHQSDNS